jgi:hypothetical protein
MSEGFVTDDAFYLSIKQFMRPASATTPTKSPAQAHINVWGETRSGSHAYSTFSV